MKLSSTALGIVSSFVLCATAAPAEKGASSTSIVPPIETHVLGPIINEGGGLTFPKTPEDGQMGTLDNFRASCDAPTLHSMYSTLLYSDCYTRDGVKRLTHIDLLNCLVNRCGVLLPGRGGRYNDSCDTRYCKIVDGTYIECACRTCDGGSLVTKVNLNDFITNENGYLNCFGINGW
ncbi:hypothetical protein HJFPF1_10746 [Paramyrothecium foliicola]|nr:hypothetical protein HJFPF1_10746 [Paramyrothecium foliicola]